MLRREPEEVFCPQLLQLRYAAQFGTNPTWKEAARSAELCLCFRLERGVQKGIVIPFDRVNLSRDGVREIESEQLSPGLSNYRIPRFEHRNLARVARSIRVGHIV